MQEKNAIKKKRFIRARPLCFQIILNSCLQVLGLLHLLGFDHGISDETEVEIEKEEEILKSLRGKGKV